MTDITKYKEEGIEIHKRLSKLGEEAAFSLDTLTKRIVHFGALPFNLELHPAYLDFERSHCQQIKRGAEELRRVITSWRPKAQEAVVRVQGLLIPGDEFDEEVKRLGHYIDEISCHQLLELATYLDMAFKR